MIKILKSLAIITAVVAIAGGGTYAAVVFKDSKTVNNNTFAAGTVKIELSRPGDVALPFTIEKWAPGDITELALNIYNSGNLAVKVPGAGTKVDGQWEGWPVSGLDKYVKLDHFEYYNGSTWVWVDNIPNNSLTINPGATQYVKAFVKFDNSVNDDAHPINDFQGKTYRANFTIVAEQAAHN